MNWQILRALPRISCMKASWVFVVGGKIQKFLRESILDPKVSSETCWSCCTRENVQMLGILLGLLLLAATFKVEQAFIGMQRVKNKVHQAQLWPPRGSLGGEANLHSFLAPDNTLSAYGASLQ